MLNLSATLFMLKRQENNISLIVISILKWNFESVCKLYKKLQGRIQGEGAGGVHPPHPPSSWDEALASYVRTHF